MNIILRYFYKIKNNIIMNKMLAQKILACLIVLITVIIIFSCLTGNEKSKSSGNSFNNGFAVQDGKWIYYIELDGNKNVGINRVKESGKKTEKVYEEAVSNIDIADDYIYCIKYEEEDNEYNLIKIKKNGKNETTLARNVDKAPIFATDKYVFYYKNNKLYRTKINGTERKEVSSKNVTYYQIVDNWIYYIYEQDNIEYIAKMKLDGTENKRISKLDSENEHYETLYVKGSKVYYILSRKNNEYENNYYLCKINKNGEKIKEICKIGSNIVYINMQEDKIYYTVSSNNIVFTTYSIEYNGTERKEIKEEDSIILNLNLTEKWIIYLKINDDSDTVVNMISINGKKEKQL